VNFILAHIISVCSGYGPEASLCTWSWTVGFQKKVGNFLTGWVTISFSRKTFIHGVSFIVLVQFIVTFTLLEAQIEVFIFSKSSSSYKKLVQWNLDFTFLDSTHVFISPAKTSTSAMLNFPGIYVCAFYPIPQLYVQIEHKLACCCRF
jgi:hypothetical protein